jgi:hypothetical protein
LGKLIGIFAFWGEMGMESGPTEKGLPPIGLGCPRYGWLGSIDEYKLYTE